MRISIITANYNGDRFLEQTIRSVLEQRTAGVDMEYIVVDGQSTDGSREIIDRYRADIDRIVIEPDEGPFDAINKGLSMATGDCGRHGGRTRQGALFWTLPYYR